MKQNLKTSFTSRAIGLMTIAFILLMNISSCTKKSDNNDAAKFVGTWHGTSTCSSGTGDMVFTAGSSGGVFIQPGTVGVAGTCQKAISINASATGNAFTVATQSFTDNCGNSYTISGGGVLNGTTLTYTLNFSGAVTASCVFTGTK